MKAQDRTGNVRRKDVESSPEQTICVLQALEQRPIVLVPKLRETNDSVSDGRIRGKLEGVLGRWRKGRLRRRRGHGHLNACVGFEEVSSERAAVAKRVLLLDAEPVNTETLDHGAHQSQRVCRIETVGHGERVKDAAQVLGVKSCLTFIQIDINTSFRDLDGPK